MSQVFKIQEFKTAQWLGNGHMQTIWGSVLRRIPEVVVRPVEIPTQDGFALIGHVTDQVHSDKRPQAVCIFLHGLTGSSESHYIRGFQKAILDAQLPIVSLAVNHRGSHGEYCTAKKSMGLYHAGLVTDLQDVMNYARVQWPGAMLCMVGVSLSGNMLVRAMGLGALPELDYGMAVSVPFELNAAADAVDRGLGRFYRRYLVERMKKLVIQKQKHFPGFVGASLAPELRTFWAFDNFVIAPNHGFRNVHHYYREASCRRYFDQIKQPLLVIQSLDDPLVPPSCWPASEHIPDWITFEAYDRGGHVGFISPDGYWLEPRLVSWLQAVCEQGADI